MTECESSVSQFVVFRIGEEQYGLPVRYVKEIQRLVSITELPHAPAYIKGVANLRGNVMTVVSGRRLLDLPEAELGPEQRILLLKGQGQQLGLLVDGLSGVTLIEPTQIYPYASKAGGWIQGLSYTTAGWFVRLMHVDKLFALLQPAEVRATGVISGKGDSPAHWSASAKQAAAVVEQYVRFQTDTSSFAVPVHHVLDIQRMPERVEPLSGAPAGMLGLAAVRGQVIPLLDAGLLLDHARTARPNRVIVLDLGHESKRALIGLVVGQATEVLRISRNEVTEIPAVLRRFQGEWVSGLYTDEKQSSVVYTLDLTKAAFMEDVSVSMSGGSGMALQGGTAHAGTPRIAKTAETSNPGEGEPGASEALLLFFQIHQDTYGIAAESIKEILRAAPITPVPHTGRAIAGLANIRGHLVTVVNLAEQLYDGCCSTASAERLIVLQAGQLLRAFPVDHIIGLRRISQISMQGIHGLRDWLPEQEELLDGMVELNAAEMAIVLNPERVCSLE